MAIKSKDIQPHLDDYKAVTGKSIDTFVCPITDSATGTLSKAHILSDGLKDTFAAQDGQCVIQYNEVDRHFGGTVERDFVKFANMPTYSFAEYAETGRRSKEKRPGEKHNLRVILADGRQFPLIPLQKNSPYKFKIIVPDDDGTPVKYSIQTLEQDLPLVVATVDATVTFRFPAVVVSLWKAGFLTMFKLCGYSFVYSRVGEFVRKPLADFIRRNAVATDAIDLFEPYKYSFNVLFSSPSTAYPARDTLRDRELLFHYLEGRSVAFSVTFDVKGTTFTMTFPTMPDVDTDDEWNAALQRYQIFINNPDNHETHTFTLQGQRANINPINIRHPTDNERIPIEDLPPHLKPCRD